MDETKFLETARDRYKDFLSIYGEVFDAVSNDMVFLDGDQWDKELKEDRIADGRPCFTINKIPKFIDQVVGEQRQNRPQIKVKPAGGKANKDVAKILAGLIRNIEQVSSANIAIDHAFEHQAAGGLGAWRILPDYASNSTFDQQIMIKPIWNALNVAWDPYAQEWDLSDAEWFMIMSKQNRKAFEAAYPDTNSASFQTDETYSEEWESADTVTVAEYFVKEKTKKTVYQIKDASGDIDVIDREPDKEKGEQVIKSREVEIPVIKWYKITSRDVLEGPTEIPGEYIPIVVVFGKELNVKGKRKIRGIVRNMKEPQQLYNYSRSHGAEIISLAPKSPYMMTPKMIEGHIGQWADAHKRNRVYMLYNPDPESGISYPKREDPPQASSGIQEQIILADGELNDTSGMPEAMLGEKSNEKSGKAILARQAKGQIRAYAYMDNLSRAMKHSGKILLSMIPKVYDTERIERIIHEDGTDEEIPINQVQEGTQEILNDITVGQYDVVVDVGPSYQTRQDEAGEAMIEFLGIYPDAAPMVADLVVSSMNWPKADLIAERLKTLLPPGMAQIGEQGNVNEQPPPGGGVAPGATSSPNQGATTPAAAPPGIGPEQQAMADSSMEIELEMAEVKLAQEKATLKKLEAEAALAELKVANFGTESTQPPRKANNDGGA